MCKFLFFSGHSLIKNQLIDIQTMNTFYTITVFLAIISSLKIFILYLIDGYNLNKCISFTESFLIKKKNCLLNTWQLSNSCKERKRYIKNLEIFKELFFTHCRCLLQVFIHKKNSTLFSTCIHTINDNMRNSTM